MVYLIKGIPSKKSTLVIEISKKWDEIQAGCCLLNWGSVDWFSQGALVCLEQKSSVFLESITIHWLKTLLDNIHKVTVCHSICIKPLDEGLEGLKGKQHLNCSNILDIRICRRGLLNQSHSLVFFTHESKIEC